MSGVVFPGICFASTLYVDLNSTNPVAPYSSWGTASTNIQVALDAASAGDLVLVTNGTYSVGSRTPVTGISCRVAVQKPLTLASANGPSTTFIVGAGRTGGFLRGVYLTNGAVLAGFTITNGTASEQSPAGSGGNGGGVYCQSTNCQVTNCVIIGNISANGGGVYQGTLLNCILFGNSGSALGGGACQSVLESCALAGNTSGQGGGVANSRLSNCTLSGNTASSSGGGAYQSTLNNCIVYYNTAPTSSNATGSTLNYCCTTPLPGSGSGNIDAEPQLASLSHLAATSPCLGAGSTAYAVGFDIDGEAWANPPSIGCDEVSASVTGPINISIVAGYTNCAAGFTVGFTGWIWGKVSSSVWDFGDGSTVSNRPYTSHVWTNGGDFPVVLTAYNQDYPGGISATAIVHVVGQPVHYVSLAGTNPVSPYISWDTAATNIQAAVNAATAPGESVLVSDGIYTVGATSAGTTTTNRVAIQQKIRVSSLNGPLVTAIQGQRASAGGGLGPDAVRCVYLGSGAVLDGFTLTNGSTTSFDDGGGVFCQSSTATVTNCILSANYAYLGAGAFSGNFINCTFQFNSAYSSGGGCYISTLTNCTLYNNGANNTAGGAVNATLYNCTLSRNSAGNYGGGMASSTLNNCVLDHNTAQYGGASGYGTLNNCIVTNNYGYTDGGGMYYGTANNCLFQGNGAGNSVDTGEGGGAAYYGTLNACLILNNSGTWYGGGTFNSTVNNCVLSGNSTLYGGAAYGGTLKNCTVVGNSGFFSGGGVDQCACYNSIICYNTQAGGTNNYTGANTFSNCCTSPDPGAGSGNITNEPLLVNLAAGDLRLLSNSPCINSGNNSFSPAGSDLDGNPRISGGTVDIGAYEFQNPASLISYAWLQQYGLPTDGSADSLDTDGDGMTNWQEWRAGTVPTNAASVLSLQVPATAPSGATITWQSVSGIKYYVQRAVPASSLTFLTIQSNILGTAATTSFMDTNAVGLGQALYRVGVQ